MAGFDNPHETWNARFAGSDYLFGEAPNAFLTREARWIPAGGSVLCVADGEGRNSVWLAEQGFAVTAFDFAENAVAKARALAAARHVAVDHRVDDFAHWPWDGARYDAVVAIFIQFASPPERAQLFSNVRQSLKPGGLLILEGYGVGQIGRGTGGPPQVEHLYTPEMLLEAFDGFEVLLLEEREDWLEEGTRHVGRSALVDFVARKGP